MSREERINSIKKLSEEFQFKIFVYSSNIDRDLIIIICMELIKKWSDMVNFIDYFQEVAFSRKIELVKIILNSNYPEIYKKYSTIFTQMGQIKSIRDKIAHFIPSYSTNGDGSETSYVLSPMIVRIDEHKEEKFSEMKMQGLMRMAEECSKTIREITVSIGKTHGHNL